MPVSLEVQIVGLEPRAVLRHGNLSRTGLYIDIDRDVGQPGDLHRLRLRSRDKKVRLEIDARIVRVVSTDDLMRGRVVSGVGFVMLAYPKAANADLEEFLAHVTQPNQQGGEGDSDEAGVGGLSIDTDWQLRKGERVRIEVPTEGGGRVRYEGHAVRSRRNRTGSFRTRVEMAPKDAAMDRPPDPSAEAKPHLSGDISRFRVTTLLTLAEVERISGELRVTREGADAVIFLREGRVVDVVAHDGADATARLSALCLWDTGAFEMILRETRRPDRVGTSTTALLLDLARAEDEAQRVA